jgi:hypothetical protein
MHVPAISIGYAVPAEDFDASVHSAFQSALNLRLNGEAGLLTLLASQEGDLPQGIRLDIPEGFSFEEFQTGERAVCRDGVLHFENSSLQCNLNEGGVGSAICPPWNLIPKTRPSLPPGVLSGRL